MMLKHVERLARFMAVLGGIVLTLLVILTCLSVLGRGLNTFGHSAFLTSLSESAAHALIASGVGPITGDFELVEAGIAFAIFAFLPYAQLHHAHATVDIFAASFPHWFNRFLIVFWEFVLSAIILLLTWRLFAGMQGKMSNGEITFLLQFPVWWAYAASFVAAVTASIVAIYCAIARILDVVTGGSHLPHSEGAHH
ncbi:TRAP transporter small permease [Aliiruegeria lutimaris]|uniref:TRAP transporter small permease protein n=1 Tax=Aliiruegeria lutimaris TaxID=571298 RepID=A0A1G8RKS7_9RHOB|nr:Tripartite ATP-independent transporter, DctQ component [Aliiruegeria lutimaris]